MNVKSGWFLSVITRELVIISIIIGNWEKIYRVKVSGTLLEASPASTLEEISVVSKE